MSVTLLTERLRLDPFQSRDAAELLELFRDPAVRRFLLDRVMVGPSWIQAEIRASDELFLTSGCGLWAVRGSGSGVIVGFAGLRELRDRSGVELLCGLNPTHWGNGIATEAARAVLDHGFSRMGLTRVVAWSDPRNGAAIRMLYRLGLRRLPPRRDGSNRSQVFQSVRLVC